MPVVIQILVEGVVNVRGKLALVWLWRVHRLVWEQRTSLRLDLGVLDPASFLVFSCRVSMRIVG